MYLKYLELVGFKSFPEKIRLKFNEGITGIVGPNGSGKSNISDAVRWVLGEQKVKTLRGSKMEDIIFNGTQNRKPLGFAQVSIIIDNSDKILPLEYNEVNITRRLYRSGESEFKINNSVCRLKDIHKLFMDTGIGKEGYSIIGQGNIEEILSSRDEERRFLFEEASGIVKYKYRRTETLDKLEKERQNLVRVNDIISEVQLKLEPLHKQSDIAKKFLALQSDLKNIEVNNVLLQLDENNKKISKVEKNIDNLNFNLKDYGRDKKNIEDNILRSKEEISLLESKISSIGSNIIELRSDIEQKENDILLKNEQNDNAKNNILNIKNQQNQLNINIEKNNIEIDKIKNQITYVENDLKNQKNLLSIKEKEFYEIINKMSSWEQQIEQYNLDIIENLKQSNIIEKEKQNISIIYNQFLIRKNTLIEDIKINNEELEIENKKFISISQDLKQISGKIEDFENRLKVESNKKEELLEDINKKYNELSIVRKNLNDNISKLNVLEDLEKSYDGYYKSVKSILLEKEKENKFKGIIGPVASLIKVKDNLELSIESALGASTQNIVTSTEYDAKEAIEYLKQNKLGKATFLPLTSIKPKSFDKIKSEILSFEGVIGIAKDIVEYDLKYENIISNLLGKVVIVNNMSTGILLGKKYNHSFKIVTKDGDVLNVGGSITGGFINNKTGNIFIRSKEIEILQKDIDSLYKKEANISIDYQSMDEKLQNIELDLDDIRNKIHSYQVDKASKIQIIDQINKNIEKYKNTKNNFLIEDKQLKEQIDNNKLKLEELQNKFDDLKLFNDEISIKLDNLQNSFPQYKEKRQAYTEEITNLKINIGVLEENYKNAIQNLEQKDNFLLENESILEKYVKDIGNLEKFIEDKKKEIDNLYSFILEQKKNRKDEEDKVLNLEKDKEKLYEILKQNEIKLQDILENISTIKTEYAQVNINLENLNQEKQNLYNILWNKYELTFHEALNYKNNNFSIKDLEIKEKSLKEEIKSLGYINVGAIEEYNETKERYNFLISQRQDIEESEEKLKDIIVKLTDLMEKQFKENFKIISNNFNQVFSDIFDGGNAYLRLNDKNNVLESGIEIIAKPPGKMLQNLSLLSGGERALTAIALLFAILKMKPSPFCVLDEIEAALDDANVIRYANYLKKLSKETQFIIITHRKGSMEVSDILYGVTMEEQGISKLVSVNLEEGSM